ncbi:15-hydroxyprostaglandin dehydrogenase [NAD(+)]-like isoform X1 [Haliotis rufescens]|uniref:15-hydroxyprostaglandin dehydrogenase [NAD(+)]-like isoform X1 n=1 Tax=Haliotis rufescens TaxID=6454 RepID=UPI00201EB05A|nr:15-hydroxyprostaglandin dehydrogenase [NAD(+)]-like isoform X1 [Haliotis rufescens]
MQIKGKVAIVTGGAGVLGQAMVRALLEKEAKVCVFDINAARGAEIEASLQSQFGGGQASFSLCDVTDEKGFKEAFDGVVARHGRVDIMVNNAGIVNERMDIDKGLMVNLGGTIRGSNLAIKHMRKDQGGQGGVVINVSSIAGLEPFYRVPSYAATKHGVIGFTRSWATNPHVKELGLRFHVVCPTAFTSYIIPEPESQLLFAEDFMKVYEQFGFEDPKNIAVAVIGLLEEDDSNGTILLTHATELNRRVKIEVTDATT